MNRKLTRWLSILLVAALLVPAGTLAPKATAASPEIPVILYHQIVDNPTNEWTHTSTEKFRRTMQYLDENGYTTLTSQQYVDIMNGEASAENIPEKPVLLTFDDATPDFLTTALPILNQHNMNAVLFVVTGWIGGNFSMSSAQLEEIASNHSNISIENHTVNHAENYWNSQELELQAASDEIAAANQYIKELTGRDPLLLAYPYGHFNAVTEEAVEQNNIQYAFKVGSPNQGQYAMARHYVMMNTTVSDIASWVGGPAPSPVMTTVYEEGFENGKGSWHGNGAAQADVTNTMARSGDNSLLVAGRTNGYNGPSLSLTTVLEKGTDYEISAYVKLASDATEDAQIKATMEQTGLTGSDQYKQVAGLTSVTKDEWVEIKGSYTYNPDATAIKIYFESDSPTVSFALDDFTIKKAGTEDDGENEPVDNFNPITIKNYNFDDGTLQGWGPRGSVVIEPATETAHEGTHSVKVTNRTATWQGVSIDLKQVLLPGANYTITGYVKLVEGEPESNMKFTVEQISGESYVQVNSAVNVTDTEWVKLEGQYSYDESFPLLNLYVESDELNAFYLDSVTIVQTSRANAQPFNTITFEDQLAGGFEPRGNSEILTVTNEANHTEDGSYSLKVENRTSDWNGPSLRVENYVDVGYEYNISAWAKLIGPSSAQLRLSTQVGNGGSASYINLASATLSADSDWVQLQGTFRYTSSGEEFLTIYIESPSVDATFYIDDISFVRTNSAPIAIEKDLTPLKDAYEDDFLIGNIVSSQDLEGLRLELLKMHHNVVTAENAMKPDAAYNANGEFDFTDENILIDRVLGEGLQMFGHVLVWHQQSPEWLHTDTTGGANTPLPREEALANLKTHIRTVMENFGDKVIGWDVLNEAMNDNPQNPTDWKGALRQSGWYKAIGPDYVEEVYLAAREVLDDHPEWGDIKLYYNDYNDDNHNKSTAIYSMVKELNEKYAETNPGKLLIDGIGMQAHYNINTNPANVELSLERFISLGVEVSITELDITAGSDNTLTEKQAKDQAYLYAQLLEIYKKHAQHIARVTFWGLEDGSSWRSENSPLLFDRSLKAKPAYYAVINPAQYIEDYEPIEKVANEANAIYGTPVIDGNVDAVWNDAQQMPINRYQSAWQGATGFAKALWDEENLYVLIQVNDAQLDKSNTETYQQDSVEIFVDQNNGKTTFYQDDDGQYRVNFDNETSFNPSSIAEGFESATVINGTNYTVEVKIPLTAITPAENTKLGFDVQINDAKDGSRQSVAAWNDTTGTGYMDTSVYGILNLKLEAVPEPTPKPTPRPGGNDSAPEPTNNSNNIITPQTTNNNNQIIATVTQDELNGALAAAGANGKAIIKLSQQSNAASYEVKLPAKSLDADKPYVIELQTPLGTISIPSSMLATADNDADQVTIRISSVSAGSLDAAVSGQVGNHPVVDVSVLVNNEVVSWQNADAPLNIAIPYTPASTEHNTDAIVVWHIDEDGNISVIPNGRYVADRQAVIFSTNHLSQFALVYGSHSFADLTSVPWATQGIEALSARGIINGVSQQAYNPQANITRADFIALLVRTLELEGSQQSSEMFSDVQPSAYYYQELAIAKALGIAAGYSDNTFRPSESISRQDMMVLTIRALQAAGVELTSQSNLNDYSDANSLAQYATSAAAKLVQAGIINGKGNKLAPHEQLTRAEAAVVLYRIWKG